MEVQAFSPVAFGRATGSAAAAVPHRPQSKPANGPCTLAQCSASAALLGAVAATRQGQRRRLLLRAELEGMELTKPSFVEVSGGPLPETITPQEPSIVIDVRPQTELVLLRSGKFVTTEVKPGCKIRLSGGGMGVLLAWKESVGILHMLEGQAEVGETAKSLGEFMVFLATKEQRGRILDAAGRTIDELPDIPGEKNVRPLFQDYKGMFERTNQYRPLFTGVTGVDFCVPIGRGQTMLFQGTNKSLDKKYLWPDLMAVDRGVKSPEGPACSIAVAESAAEALSLQEELKRQGVWERCAIIVPSSDSPGAYVVAMNAAMALAEEISEENGEATVLMNFEPMSRVWNVLAEVAGWERQAKGIISDPSENIWTEMEGTVLRESIAERRKFWFALVSRAANSVDGGSVSLLAWLWEQEQGLRQRKRKAYETKLEQALAIPRITEAVREKLAQKVKAEAAAEGITLGDRRALVAEVDPEAPGVPNWEIEELKSITDGHILLKTPEFYASEETKSGASWCWNVNAYVSLPRLGTDALHPALISVEAHKVRLLMFQGRDRATMIKDTRGSADTLGMREGLELRYMELLMEQPGGLRLSVPEEVARLIIVACPNCVPLSKRCTPQQLAELVPRLLGSAAGQKAIEDLEKNGEVSGQVLDQLQQEVLAWSE